MTKDQNRSSEIFEEGARCLASPDGYWAQGTMDGYWAQGTIHRVNEDGTFTIEFDKKHKMWDPYWYGVTKDQISVKDQEMWPEVFKILTSGSMLMDESAFAYSMSRLGYQVNEKVNEFWDKECKNLFKIDPNAKTTLNDEQAYQLILKSGNSAKRFILKDRPDVDYFKLYWNQIRMGGRQPSELPRSVTVEDAFLAVGISQPESDSAIANRLQLFQEDNSLELPANLKRFLCCKGISKAVHKSHANCPELTLPGEAGFCFYENPQFKNLEADYAITIRIPHQGHHTWVAAFNAGDQDAKIYIVWEYDDDDDDDEVENWQLTSPSIGMFFWDLAQTGLIWYQNTGYKGGKSFTETDIGIIPAAKKLWQV